MSAKERKRALPRKNCKNTPGLETPQVFGFLSSIGRQRVSAFEERVCRKRPFKHSYTAKCKNRLRVGVHSARVGLCPYG